jgi:hypothetical protein
VKGKRGKGKAHRRRKNRGKSGATSGTTNGAASGERLTAVDGGRRFETLSRLDSSYNGRQSDGRELKFLSPTRVARETGIVVAGCAWRQL